MKKIPFWDYEPSRTQAAGIYLLAWVLLGGVLALLGVPAPWALASTWLNAFVLSALGLAFVVLLAGGLLG